MYVKKLQYRIQEVEQSDGIIRFYPQSHEEGITWLDNRPLWETLRKTPEQGYETLGYAKIAIDMHIVEEKGKVHVVRVDTHPYP